MQEAAEVTHRSILSVLQFWLSPVLQILGPWDLCTLEISVPQNSSTQAIPHALLPPLEAAHSVPRWCKACAPSWGSLLVSSSLLVPLTTSLPSAGLFQSHLEEKEANKLLPARSQMPVQKEPWGKARKQVQRNLEPATVTLWHCRRTLQDAVSGEFSGMQLPLGRTF